MLGGLTGGGGLQQTQDLQIIVEYARSRSMVENIENDINLRQIFSREGIDHISRFNPNKPIEALVRYWRKRVDTHYERMSGIITLEVRAFTPEEFAEVGRKNPCPMRKAR